MSSHSNQSSLINDHHHSKAGMHTGSSHFQTRYDKLMSPVGKDNIWDSHTFQGCDSCYTWYKRPIHGYKSAKHNPFHEKLGKTDPYTGTCVGPRPMEKKVPFPFFLYDHDYTFHQCTNHPPPTTPNPGLYYLILFKYDTPNTAKVAPPGLGANTCYAK